MKKILIFLLFCIIMMGTVSAADTFFKTHGFASNVTAADTTMRGIIFRTTGAGNLTSVTKFAGSLATGVALYSPNGTNIANATYSGNNATFATPIHLANQSYFIVCQVGMTQTAFYEFNIFPHAIVNITFIASQDCNSGFANQTGNVREISGITMVYGAPVAVSTPTIALDVPINNSNLTSNASFVVTVNSTNSSFQLTNVSLYLNGALNETKIITGTSNITTFSKIVTIDKIHNWTAYVCDTFNCSLMAANRSFRANKIYEESQNFNLQGLEVSSQTFKVNVSLSSGYTISTVNFTYNQTNYSATFSSINSTLYQASVTISLPTVAATVNKTFNWTFLLTDATSFVVANRQQSVLNLGLDNCSVNNITILNFTMVDEKTQTTLNATGDNTTIRIDVSLFSDGTKTVLSNSFAGLFNQTLPARVCISNELGTTNFFMDAQVEYTSNARQVEFYNIQNYSLNASVNPVQNTTLYDLLSTEAQVFKITYKDATFLPVANALIQIQRKYVSEGVFKTVEIPKTDTTGQTVGNLVINDVIYSFTVVKDGEILGVFQNVQAVCQNPAIEECIIDLNSFSSTIPVTDFETAKDFSFTFFRNTTNRTIWADFTIPSGAVANISLLVVKQDALEEQVCFTSVVTSAGTLSCTVSANFGNGTIFARLYKNGELIAAKDLTLARTPQQIYGASLAILGLFIILTLVGAGLSDSPVFTVLFLMVGVILLYAMTLVDGAIGVGSTILWIFIAIIIVAIKGTQRT